MQWKKNLGLYIKEERKRQKLSQEELGYRSGVSRSHVGCVERGEKKPGIDMIKKLSKGLGIKYEDLFKITKD